MRSESGDGEGRELRVRLGAHRGAPGEARQLVGWIGPSLPPQRLADLRVIATELVTNAVLHGSTDNGPGWVELRLQLDDQRVRLEVIDSGQRLLPSAAPEVPTRPPDVDRLSGRGLFIVARLSDRWGIAAPSHVWVELDR